MRTRRVSKLPVLLLAFLASASSASAIAAGPQEVKLVIRNHRFVPAEVHVPANTKLKLLVINQDKSPEEFESHELNREKVVVGGGTIQVFVGPLKPGRYPFFGEFHMDTAQGALIAK